MNASLTAATSFFFRNQKDLTDLVYGVFGIMDFIHVYRHSEELSTTLKVAHIARGAFYIFARAFPRMGIGSPLPFITACVLGVGLHAYESNKSPDRYTMTKNALGAISDLSYVIFFFAPNPVLFSLALVTAGIKFTMAATPVAVKMFKPCCC